MFYAPLTMRLDLFRGVVPFVAVAEARSFRAAATRLGVSVAAVSKAVKALEVELGVPLLARTTRAVALTPQGEVLLERSRVAVAAMQGARDTLDGAHRAPRGPLVISAPFVVAPLVTAVLPLLRARYPELRFTLRVSDALAKVGEGEVDLALRVGVLADSTLVARKLCSTRIVSAATPAYLSRRGTPHSLEQLERHDCLVLVAPNGKPRPWLFASGPRAVPATMLVDHGPSLVDAALSGLGICQAFDFMVQPLIATGALVEVLPQLAATGPNIFAVCTAAKKTNPNVRVAIDALAKAFAAKT
jgi:DNA-binding transcriptional LysR family regulator